MNWKWPSYQWRRPYIEHIIACTCISWMGLTTSFSAFPFHAFVRLFQPRQCGLEKRGKLASDHEARRVKADPMSAVLSSGLAFSR